MTYTALALLIMLDDDMAGVDRRAVLTLVASLQVHCPPRRKSSTIPPFLTPRAAVGRETMARLRPSRAARVTCGLFFAPPRSARCFAIPVRRRDVVERRALTLTVRGLRTDARMPQAPRRRAPGELAEGDPE